MLRIPTLLLVCVSLGCATVPAAPAHGTLSNLSSVEAAELCAHRVPETVCTRDHPELIAQFQRVNDWCAEHGIPESQCFACHPDLEFSALPQLPETADVVWLSRSGEDVLDLQAVPGKVTIFEFYADWCAPCRKIDAHVYRLLQTREDLALRKLNVVGWESPLAKRHLGQVASLPYVVVFGKDGKRVQEITGFDLPALDRAIAEGTAR